jgi:hypothetical protein
MLRSIGAIVLGFLLIGTLAMGTERAIIQTLPEYFDTNGRTDDVALLLATLAYVFLFATLGCWVTARLAPARPMRHALILGALGLAFNVAGSIAMWHTAPVWYHVVGLGLTLPAAWLGGWIRERQVGRTGTSRLAAA